MHFGDYVKDKAYVLLLNGAALLILSVYLRLLGNTGTSVFLIDVVWVMVLAVYMEADYAHRRRYFQTLLTVLEELPERYLIAEVMQPDRRLEDRLYWEILRRSNKSVIEKLHELEDGQKAYKEYIESWIHEVKTPVTAARLICENERDSCAGRLLPELDVIENEVEKVLYYARMGQVYQDYLIHPVHLRETVLSAVRGEKRHFIQCGMQIDLDMADVIVSTDEKWIRFMLKQIFSNCIKYRRKTDAHMKIYVTEGSRQKSLIIEDNGCGIVPEDLKRVFEKGFTGQNGRQENSRATGMGLYFCKRLCDKLGMGIVCESEPGAGTRVILTFPDSDFQRILPNP